MGTAALKLAVRGYMPGGDEFRNIFYYATESDFNDTTVSAWCTGLYNTIKGSMPTSWSVYGVDVATRLTALPDTDPLGWGASVFVPVTVAGVNAADPLPPGDAYVIVGQTGVKHVMARKFLSGCLESFQSSGIVDAAMVTVLNSFGTYWLTPTAVPVGAGPVTAVTWGPTHGFTSILSYRSNNHVFHLRRRQKGRGI